jgi:hypothetical protein
MASRQMTLFAPWPPRSVGCSGTQTLFVDDFLLGIRHTASRKRGAYLKWGRQSKVMSVQAAGIRGYTAFRNRGSGQRAQVILHFTKADKPAFFRCQTNTANQISQVTIVSLSYASINHQRWPNQVCVHRSFDYRTTAFSRRWARG